MASPLKLETLAGPSQISTTIFLPGDRLARIRREAEQTGYALGYQKAQEDLEAQKTETATLLARKVQDVAFTHFEARKAIMNSLEALIDQIIKVVIPGIAQDALSDVVTAQVVSVAALLTDGPVRLICAPSHVAALKQALKTLPETPVQTIIVADPDLHDLEIRIASPECERHIDLDRVLAGIQQGVSAFYKLSMEEQKHG